MVLCSEDNATFSVRYNRMNNMNSYAYSPQPQEQYVTSQMGNGDAYSQFQVSYSDPSIQQLAHSASWAGVYAARSGHGAVHQDPVPHGQGSILDDWSSPTPQQYCTSSNSDSSPSPNGYSYPMPYRTAISPGTSGLDYNIPSPEQTTTPTGHGTGVSVIASHQSHLCTLGERSSCQGSPTGSRPLRPPYDWMKRQTYQTVPSAGKTRTKDKYRVVYTDHQRLELEKEFHYSRYITIRRKAELAQSLSLSERQVKIWFQNRRAKERKQKKKEDASGGVKVISEVPVQGQSLTHTQSVQMHSQPHPALPPSELSQSQTPHLTHTRVQTQDMMRQEEVPNSSAMEGLQP